jgi:ribosome-associated protein
MEKTIKKKRAKATEITSETISQLVVHGMQEIKGIDIVLMDMRNVKNTMTDFFVICSGNTENQVDAIADSVEDEITKATGINPWHREGREAKEWVLLDYVDVVVHVFKKDRREFYDLEELWGDAEFTQFKDQY